ncbi:hypothetical protein JAAARDRAFT_200305 [Jaapia argillacea MUCL 33604]|uniref:F-box domain-containing protein n=1 Tax=Jaapia argillacea MUCL 33604 TaxID=933084 RepID=A0A067P580_9AGAM|nr:hypothetical protein JAAARDRAFT_200305 [Jaapia argillacea MUCL 33604]
MICTRVLSILEVQRIVLAWLRDCCDESDRPKSNLLSAARSTRLFRDAAIELIWQDLHSLDPLWRLIPESEQSDDGIWASLIQLVHLCSDLMETHFTFQTQDSEDMNKEDRCYERFRFYAAQVQGIKVLCNEAELTRLYSCDKFVLPGLKSLVWNWYTEVWVDESRWAEWIPRASDREPVTVALSRFLSMTLEWLEINGRVPTILYVALTELIESLPATCPSLKGFQLTGSEFPLSTIMKPLSSLRGLESMRFSDPPCLDGLDVPAQVPFRSLQSLRLDSLSLNGAPRFLDSLSTRGTLRGLSVKIRSKPNGATIPTQLASVARLSSLTRLVLYLDLGWDSTLTGSELLAPLLALRSIKELRVIGRGPSTLLSNATDVADMRRSWPWLRSLILGHPSLSFHLRVVHGFSSFANLAELRLKMYHHNCDFKVDPEWELTSGLVIFDCDIIESPWILGDYTYPKMARYLHAIFPKMQPMVHWHTPSYGWKRHIPGVPGDAELHRNTGGAQMTREAGGKTGGKMGEKTEGKVGEKMEGKAGEKTEGKAGEKTEGKAGENTEGKVGEKTDGKAGEKTEKKVGGKTGENVVVLKRFPNMRTLIRRALGRATIFLVVLLIGIWTISNGIALCIYLLIGILIFDHAVKTEL